MGDTDGLGTLDEADQPAQVGDIRLKVYNGNPQTASPSLEGRKGEILFSSENNGSLFLHNGSAWVAQGGGSGIKWIRRGWDTINVPAGTTANKDLTIDPALDDITKAEVKVWYTVKDVTYYYCNIAPLLTSKTSLKVYADNEGSLAAIYTIAYEIIEYE